MLSRVAESLYWTARYVERAEDVTRLLDVDYHALLDAHVADHDEAWRRLVATARRGRRLHGAFRVVQAQNVADWLLWHEATQRGRRLRHARAGERALGARADLRRDVGGDQPLFLLVGRANRRAVSRGPHAFFEQLRNGAHLFQGLADATMAHGEPYEFLQLGLHLERAEKTIRIVRPLPGGSRPRGGRPGAALGADRAAEVVLRLRGVRPPARHAARAARIAESSCARPRFPRAALYCLRRVPGGERGIARETDTLHRVLGRLCAELEYGEVVDASGPR